MPLPRQEGPAVTPPDPVAAPTQRQRTDARRSLRRSRVALVLGGLATALVVVEWVHGARLGDPFELDDVANTIATLAFLVVGFIVARRRPEHPIGWLLLSFVLFWTVAGWFSAWSEHLVLAGGREHWWIAMIGTFGFAGVAGPMAGVILLFPTGRLVSRRWRWLPWLLGFVLVMAAFGTATAQDFKVRPVDAFGRELEIVLVNPWGQAAWLEPVRAGIKPLEFLGLVLVAGIVVHAIVRFRRSTGIERLQMRWLVYTLVTVLTVVPVLGQLVTVVAGSRVGEAYGALAFGLVLTSLPVGIGVAVLRYRLFDIDRLVSRTVTYAILTAVLAGVYAVGVLGIGSMLPGGSSDLLVAASTLAVAALFRPVRRRVKLGVDRRFNRSRYDAIQVVEAFGARLRDQLDLDALRAGLSAAAHETLAPAAVSVWMRPTEART